MKTNKTLLWVGIGSALLIGGGLFWWFKNKSKTDENVPAKKNRVFVPLNTPCFFQNSMSFLLFEGSGEDKIDARGNT